jgi:phage-related protein
LLEGLAIAIGLVTLAIDLYTGSTLIMNGVMAIATGIAGAFGTIMAFVTSPITLVTLGIALLVAGIILLVKNWDKVKEVAGKVWDKIKEIWGKVADWFNDKVITPVKEYFAPIKDWFSKLFTSIWKSIESAFTVISGLAKGCWEIITHVWGVASKWFNDKVIAPVKNFFAPMWNSLIEGGRKAWTGIKNVFSKVSDWFKETFSKAWSKVKGVFSAGGKVFSGIKEGIEKTFKTVVNSLISGINKIIAVPFNTINGMLNKIRNIDIMGLSPFKDKWKQNPLSVPQIPQLARGGVVDSPTVAMIGEAGKEAVVPLENNTGWIDKLADKIGDKIGGGDTPIKLTVKLGEDTIFDKFIEYTKDKAFQTNGEVFAL